MGFNQAMGPSKPRRQQLTCSQGKLPEHLFAVVRLSWFRRGKIYRIEEMNIEQANEDIKEALLMLFKEALKQGADVNAIIACNPADLGIEQ